MNSSTTTVAALGSGDQLNSDGITVAASGSACQLTSSRPKALISWSSGKDSAFALHEVRRAGEFDVVGALTTVTETFGRVSIQGAQI